MNISGQRVNVIYDNGGGITLQILGGESDYQHYFQCAEQASETVYAALMATNSDSADDIQMGWDGNDLDDDDIELLEPTDEQQRNGGYMVLLDTCYHDVVEMGIGSSWFNAADLSDRLDALATAETNV